jgi:hypothetical protein
MSDKNLELRINIKFGVMMAKGANETLTLLTFAYDEYAMKKSSVLNGIGGSRKEEIMCKMSQEVDSQKSQKLDANLDAVRIFVRLDQGIGVICKC